MDIDNESSRSSGQLGNDAKVLIMELNKGLQSKDLGIQCEAIAQFSNLVEKYPFPVVINTFTKLVDVFVKGSNYLRQCILKTCCECGTHLQKMTCVEDIIPNISNVMHSNDPVARSFTLRLFGILCSVLREKKNIHHFILMQLDSHYSVELDATLWASHKFAATSKSFAASLCPKVKLMLESLSTDTEVKLKLIPLCKHMHHEASTLEEIRDSLVNLLTAYQSTDFVVTVLHTLTVLAARSPIHATQQLNLLLDQLRIEKRIDVQSSVLKDLKILAKHVPHIWAESHFETMCTFYGGCEDKLRCKELTIEVLCIMADSVAISAMTSSQLEGTSPQLCAMEAVLSADTGLTSRGVRLLTSLARQGSSDEAEEAAIMILGLFNTGWHLQEMPAEHLRLTYRSLANLIIAYPELVGIVEDMNLFEGLTTGSSSNAVMLCEFLCSVSSRVACTSWTVAPAALLDRLLQRKPRLQESAIECDLGPLVCALVFQLSTGQPLASDDRNRVLAFLNEGKSWTAYKVARQASRYGQHRTAAIIYDRLAAVAASEKFVFWLKGLAALSNAEDLLYARGDFSFTQLIDSLRISMDHLYRAKSAFACVSSREFWFHSEYIRVRCKFLNALYDLAVLASHGSRPNASATSLKVLSHNKSLDESIGDLKNLTQRSIDADDATLRHLNLLRNLIQIVSRPIASVVNQQVKEMPSNAEIIQDTTYMSTCAVKLAQFAEQTLSDIIHPTENITEALKTRKAMEMLITLVDNVSRIPLCLPRFFFQRLQSTDIRLVLLPRYQVPHEAYPVNMDIGHMLQVMGVVQQRSPLPQLPRRINKVLVQVFCDPSGPQSSTAETESTTDQALSFSREVRVLKDFFICQFLISFPAPSHYRLRVIVQPFDVSGQRWSTGHSDTMLIRADRVGPPGPGHYGDSQVGQAIGSAAQQRVSLGASQGYAPARYGGNASAQPGSSYHRR